MFATRLIAVCSLVVLATAAHAANLTPQERAQVRKQIRADAKASPGIYPSGQSPSLRVRFKDNANGTTTASASTLLKMPAWPTFNLVRRTHATAEFTVTPSVLTVTPAPPPTVTRDAPWAIRMYALNNGN